MSPENQWLEDVFPIEIVPFQGTLLFFRGVAQFISQVLIQILLRISAINSIELLK